MSKKSNVKEEFPTLEDLMFRNDRAIQRHKKQKYFERIKPFKKFKKGMKRL